MASSKKIPKVAKVKNKMPAEIQITAEQLLREAKERDLEILPPPPKQKISDPEELAEYQLRKRKTFEDNIRKNRTLISNWIKYAQWEESQKEIQRARSVFERALDMDSRNPTLWLKYAEMEMKNKQVNHARNLWDRAVTLLPRVNQFWLKYTYMEEMLGNIAGARQIFERWMQWEPYEQAWFSYIKFELRYNELARARAIYERFVIVHPLPEHWIRYARFEENHGNIAEAREIYERAIEFFGDEYMDEKLFIAFAKFEETQREHDRVRTIYKYALERFPKAQTREILKNYTIHEKKYGDRAEIEDVVLNKRKNKYQEDLKADPLNYDTWFDLLRLMESEIDTEADAQTFQHSIEAVRETYEQAITNLPPSKEKRFWRRYIYLWIHYAIFEEAICGDVDRARQVYHACLKLIPHRVFTFAKVWVLAAELEVRCKNLYAARKLLGNAIGACPKEKLFKEYIDLEMQLREFGNCRKLYEKFLEFAPENCRTWQKWAELEALLGDTERARVLYQVATEQARLDMPELVWKAYIDFEIDQGEYDNARAIYEKLLERTQHPKVWLTYITFELEHGGKVPKARALFERANQELKNEENEVRLMMLEEWLKFEEEHGDDASKERVQRLMPKRVKRIRKRHAEDGSDAGWEEYYDFIFATDETDQPHLKILEKATLWKKKMEEMKNQSQQQTESEENSS